MIAYSTKAIYRRKDGVLACEIKEHTTKDRAVKNYEWWKLRPHCESVVLWESKQIMKWDKKGGD